MNYFLAEVSETAFVSDCKTWAFARDVMEIWMDMYTIRIIDESLCQMM
jgi:hypothetical protein